MGNNINEVRERLAVLSDWAVIGRGYGDDLRTLLAAHARLQAKNAELTAAVRGLLDALPSASTHQAIAAARKAVQP